MGAPLPIATRARSNALAESARRSWRTIPGSWVRTGVATATAQWTVDPSAQRSSMLGPTPSQVRAAPSRVWM